jgi:hypothetical protein
VSTMHPGRPRRTSSLTALILNRHTLQMQQVLRPALVLGRRSHLQAHAPPKYLRVYCWSTHLVGERE